MIKKTIVAMCVTGMLAGCVEETRITGGELVDAGSTAAGLATGLAEGNPIWSWCGNAAPLCVLGGKIVIKSAAIRAGADPEQVDKSFHTAGMAAGCWNVATIAGAATGVGAIAGAICYFIALHQWEKREREQREHFGIVAGRREEEV